MDELPYLEKIKTLSTQDLLDEVLNNYGVRNQSPYNREMYYESYSLLVDRIKDLENSFDASM